MSLSKPPVYVLWLGPTGLTVVRALGREGIPVVACHDDANEPCTDTRYARVAILPSLDEHPQAWLEFLLNEAKSFGGAKAVLIVAADAHWMFVARHREALRQHFLFALPEAADILEWPTKVWQQRAAARAAVPCPRSLAPASVEDLLTFATKLTYPCLIKPSLSHAWRMHYSRKVAFVRSPDELLHAGEDALRKGLAFSVQEYIPARDCDIYGLYCTLDRNSQPLAMCVSHKLRQFEPRFGSGCLCECVEQPEVAALGLRFLQSIGYRGIASVEFKLDPRDGQFKLMEANLRAPLMMGHALDCGVNMPLALYRDLIGEPAPLQLPRRFGRRVGLIGQDHQSARFYRRHGEGSLLGWIRQWLGTRDLHFAWDDLRPFRGYLHMLWDHHRRGRFKHDPEWFPTADEWEAGMPAPSQPRSRATVREPERQVAPT